MKSICAICHNTNETTKLCKKHRLDPVNIDWVEQPYEEISVGDVEALFDSPKPTKLARAETAKSRKVIDMIANGYITEIVELKRDKGFIEENRTRRKMTDSEIARQSRCTPAYVKYLKKTI